MTPTKLWWVWVDSNHRPHAYQACALTGLSYRPKPNGHAYTHSINLNFLKEICRQRSFCLCYRFATWARIINNPHSTNLACTIFYEGFLAKAKKPSLERRWSSRRFPYGYLVTTSPQSLILPWSAASCKQVSPPASGKTNSHGVTGGVYKARERIHRGMLIHDY